MPRPDQFDPSGLPSAFDTDELDRIAAYMKAREARQLKRKGDPAYVYFFSPAEVTALKRTGSLPPYYVVSERISDAKT
jgi:hypothetical protein